MAKALDVLDRVIPQFRALSAMGYTLREARQACPQQSRLSYAKLGAYLRARGITFAGMGESENAKTYPIARAKKSIRRAIRESGAPISAQAVRYRVNVMGWPLAKALKTPTMTRAESGRMGVEAQLSKRS